MFGETPSPWPEGCEGAVSLTFDDGLPSQRERALPILQENGLRGTFYVNPRHDWRKWLAPWREVALAGHEVGNHTCNHPCSRNFGWEGRRPLEELTLAEIEADILEASRRLRALIPEQTEFTFCYPCYQDSVGAGEMRQSYVPLVAKHFPAGRARGEIANHPAKADLAHLSSFPAERMSGAELVGLAERAATQGRWTIFTFHGIEQGHLAVSAVDFRELCAHLNRHRQRIWCAPVVEVARRLIEWRSRALEERLAGTQPGDP